MISFKRYKAFSEAEEVEEPKKEEEKESPASPAGKFQCDVDDENPDVDFNKDQAMKDAETWLIGKYGDGLYDFVHVPGIEEESEGDRTYTIAVDGRAYVMVLRKFEASTPNKDGDLKASVGWDIRSPQTAIEPGEEEMEPEL